MDAVKVRKILWSCNENPFIASAIRDLFAAGCYFHAQGKTSLGLKVVGTALEAAKAGNNNELEIYASLAGNEPAYFHAAGPHMEMRELMPDGDPF